MTLSLFSQDYFNATIAIYINPWIQTKFMTAEGFLCRVRGCLPQISGQDSKGVQDSFHNPTDSRSEHDVR